MCVPLGSCWDDVLPQKWGEHFVEFPEARRSEGTQLVGGVLWFMVEPWGWGTWMGHYMIRHEENVYYMIN